METESIKKIDDVLNYMAIKENIVFLTISDIEKGLNNPQSEQIELFLILNKLIKDHFVELLEQVSTNTVHAYLSGRPETIRRYIITFEGRLHKARGGYHEANRARLAENTRLGILERRQIENDEALTHLTCWVAFGSVLAALVAVALLILQWYAYGHPVATK